MTVQHSAAPRLRLSPMRPRDPGEEGRAASTLELFFDLVFVIAVSIASSHLHDTITAGRLGEGLVSYLLVFFGIWWAWMNFTWFATSFDTDDWLYRVLTIVQMGGVLILAEVAVPVIAEARGTTPWHPDHITERYGCSTIIVLGESLLASANTIFDALG